MPNFATEDDSIAARVIERWKEGAFAEVDDIRSWRDADPADRAYHYWPNRRTMLHGFCTDTTYLVGTITSKYPKLDPTPLQDIYAAITAWCDDHSASRIPPQNVLFATLERAMMTLQAVEHNIINAAEIVPVALLPLTDNEKMVISVVKKLKPGKAMPAKEIIGVLAVDGLVLTEPRISEMRKSEAMKQRGFSLRKGAGYFLAPKKNVNQP